jgi:hypothetical protein
MTDHESASMKMITNAPPIPVYNMINQQNGVNSMKYRFGGQKNSSKQAHNLKSLIENYFEK